MSKTQDIQKELKRKEFQRKRAWREYYKMLEENDKIKRFMIEMMEAETMEDFLKIKSKISIK
jgi:hypothetical protein